MLKVMEVPDLHLYDKDIGVSMGYAEQSVAILDQIIEEFDRGEYDLVILGGDIQHAKITNTRYISEFQKKLSILGSKVKGRLEETGKTTDLEVYNSRGELVDISMYDSYLFSIKGNHDENNVEGFTFFDLLVENLVIINEYKLRYKGLQISLVDYTRDIEELTRSRDTDALVHVGVYHNLILEYGVVDTVLGKTISPNKYGMFKGVDVAIVNDIHKPIPVYTSDCTFNETYVVTPGSLGRTSYNESHDRDYGNIVVMEYADGDLSVDLVEIELVPSDKFFNKKTVVAEKLVENAFENFCIEVESADIGYFDIEEELNKIEGLSVDVKEICMDILGLVD